LQLQNGVREQVSRDEFGRHMFLAIKEKRFAKRVIKRLMHSHSAVSAEKPGLSGNALYREVLLHSQQVDPLRADQI
jgi:hypothetical protein